MPNTRLPMVKMLPAARVDVGRAVAHMVDELLAAPSAIPEITLAIDHLRQRLHATDALVWLCGEQLASRAVSVGSGAAAMAETIRLDNGAGATPRLRSSGTVLCRAGDVTGLEDLVPSSVGSFTASAAIRRDAVAGVLIVCWSEPTPPMDESEARQLGIAAALIVNVLTHNASADVRPSVSDDIVRTITDRVAVVDGNGVITMANAAWTDFALRHEAAPAGGIL